MEGDGLLPDGSILPTGRTPRAGPVPLVQMSRDEDSEVVERVLVIKRKTWLQDGELLPAAWFQEMMCSVLACPGPGMFGGQDPGRSKSPMKY